MIYVCQFGLLSLSLFPGDSPDEVLAVAAERRLLEEARDEAVVVDLGDVLLLERAHSLARLARLVLGVAVVDGARHGAAHRGGAGQRHDDDGDAARESALKKQVYGAVESAGQRARYCGHANDRTPQLNNATLVLTCNVI